MNTSQTGIDFIKSFEGCRLDAYKCPAGVWTIGYGTTAKVKQGMQITLKEAEDLLRKDLKKFEDAINKCVKAPLTQGQFDALVSFTYNCGIGALQTSTLLKKLNNKDYIGAANEFLRWDKANGKVLAGLSRRRESEREMFLFEQPKNELPYDVKTIVNLNVRKYPINGDVVTTLPKGTVLRVWAEQTVNGDKWGKNELGFFALRYTERL